jgi:diguanylate cyclase (GGDEF)-like protein
MEWRVVDGVQVKNKATANNDLARDAETGLYNELFMREMLSRLFQLYDRGNGPGISVFLFLTESAAGWPERGQAAAEARLLAQVAHALSVCTRGSDIPVYLGDNLFAVFLVGARPDLLQPVAERIREFILHFRFDGALIDYPPMLHGGIAMRRTREALEALLERAESALQEARKAGRNQIRAAVDYFPV